MSTFQKFQLIRFAHCDPAGIVFYPRYMEMINNLVEDWFAEALGYSFEQLHLLLKLAVPTVHLSTDFIKVTRLGETLCLSLRVEKLGSSSCSLIIEFHGMSGQASATDLRLRANLVLVTMDMASSRAQMMPAALRRAMQAYDESQQG